MMYILQEMDLAKQVGTCYKFTISSGGIAADDKREWTVDLRCTPPFVGHSANAPSASGKPEVEISLNDEVMMQLAQGKMKPDQVS